MSKSSLLSRKRQRKRAEKAAKTRKKKWLINISFGVAAVILIAGITYLVWPKTEPEMKLKVEDLVVGTGIEARNGDTLIVDYTSWLYGKENSEPLDSSVHRGDPIDFVLGEGQVIKGWDQGLAGMKVGGKRKLTIPSYLAYGSQGSYDGRIPPDTALVYEVELLDVFAQPSELPPTSIKELKVEDKVIGTGTEARTGSTVSVHYTGWLEDGTKFDSSLDRGEPIEFVLGEGKVIDGWEQGLIGMKAGGVRKLTIPPGLAYGARGKKNYIPPNAALIFEVELVSVK